MGHRVPGKCLKLETGLKLAIERDQWPPRLTVV